MINRNLPFCDSYHAAVIQNLHNGFQIDNSTLKQLNQNTPMPFSRYNITNK